MKVIKRNQAKEYQNSDNCSGFEFDLGDKNIDGAVVEVTGRYPEKGNAINTECREMAYIIEGKGKISIKGELSDIESEDLVIIDKGEEYFWDGEFKLFVYCTPAWNPNQHKVVD